ncbi:MAG: M48 family metalloprotease [Desulfatitalea sp.]|nr:M48 family metalloprotease [Desulfatitalea sp.]NNJ99157.1 M48 family metalloprotease [Desulfatitalea sp.]
MRIIFFRLGAIIPIVVCLCAAVPAPGHAERMRVRISSIGQKAYTQADIDAEKRFGHNLAARILGNYPLWQNAKVNHYVNLVGHALTLFTGRQELTFSFAILDTETINAFATPGGYIFITRGALANMHDEAQLAAVLAHEIAHVLERHMIRELHIKATGDSVLSGFAELIGGATGGVRGSLESSLNQAADILFHRGYRVADELSADRVGALLTATTGYDPTALKRFLEQMGPFEATLKAQDRDHPDTLHRLACLQQVLSTNGLHAETGQRNKERFHEMVLSR